jgi:voltage-dependent potassium channel beta subunit
MQYRHLGRTGLLVSALGYGSWVTFAEQIPLHVVQECLVAARSAGVTVFDTAETYANGQAEDMLGAAIEDLGWDRSTYVLSTKLFWGLHDWPHLHHTLNRKYLMQGIDGCLARLRSPFVDLLLCHRRDPDTPVEEVVWAMTDIVSSGKALYWGTSEWPAADVRAAWEYAERHSLRKPVVEQPEYNLFARRRFASDYAGLADQLGLGLMTWSPLASGLLTGKYWDGVPAGSRGALPRYEWLQRSLTDTDRNRRVVEFATVARELDCSPAQLAIAWCTLNPAVSSVLIGASSLAQLRHNMAALDVATRLNPQLIARIEQIFD